MGGLNERIRTLSPAIYRRDSSTLCRCRRGHRHSKCGSDAYVTLELDRTLERIDSTLDNRQAQPCTRDPAHVARSVKRLKQARLVFLRDANAFVLNSEDYRVLLARQVKADASALRRILHGVRKQIDQDVAKQRLVR